MAILFELMVMLLATYFAGIGIGWLVWGRAPEDMGE